MKRFAELRKICGIGGRFSSDVERSRSSAGLRQGRARGSLAKSLTQCETGDSSEIFSLTQRNPSLS
jgi:hypothetical protein